ncbi:lipoprotein [Escherichia coli]|uniref:Lipoprotein n=1 Tax=Escherichia coli TaxID=562 RepID=A0A377A475_ECOLX|nr:lipoprotein [Escherichia coli]
MAYSVQKSRLAKVAGVSLVLLLAACSSDSRYKRQSVVMKPTWKRHRLRSFMPGWNDFAGGLR